MIVKKIDICIKENNFERTLGIFRIFVCGFKKVTNGKKGIERDSEVELSQNAKNDRNRSAVYHL